MTISRDAAISGMVEQQRNIAMIANNLANMNTTGYKRVQVHFQDVLDTLSVINALTGELPPDEEPTLSAGVESLDVLRTFTQGSLRRFCELVLSHATSLVALAWFGLQSHRACGI